MASFRILDPLQTYLNQDGTAPASGGYFLFFEAGTTTPKAVYEGPDLVVSNGDRIDLDAAGRIEAEAWGSGSYRVRQFDADDTLVRDTDNWQAPGGAGQTLPPMEAGAFITTDGAQWLMDFINQLPDPTGQAGKFVKTDGTGWSYEAITIPPAATPDIVVGADSFRAGVSTNPQKWFVQWGSGSAPASAQTGTSTNVSFPTAFDARPFVFVVPTTQTVAAENQLPAAAVVNQSAGGFSVAFNTDDFGRTGSRIQNPVTFDWVAFGHKTVP